MCRLLAIRTISGFPYEYLEAFRKLAMYGRVRRGTASGHNAGWGLVLYDGEKPRYLAREPRSAFDDPRYLQVSEMLSNDSRVGMMIAHLRKAGSKGGHPSIHNTHPFIEGNWAFAHNGGITRFNIKPRGLQGVTDSERFFRHLINRVRKSGSFEEALSWSVSFVRRKYRYSALNFILSDGNTLYAYRDCAEAEDYYTMLYKHDSGAVLISQEPLDDGKWFSIPNRCLAQIREDLSVELRPLEHMIY